jgi:hypothetical protein
MSRPKLKPPASITSYGQAHPVLGLRLDHPDMPVSAVHLPASSGRGSRGLLAAYPRPPGSTLGENCCHPMQYSHHVGSEKPDRMEGVIGCADGADPSHTCALSWG